MITGRLFVFLCFFFGIAIGVNAQKSAKDSLKLLLKKETNDQRKVDLLNQLSYQYFDFSDTVAFDYAQQAQTLAKQIGYAPGLKYAYTLIGLGYTSRGQFSKAAHYHRLSDKIPGDPKKTFYNLTLWGILYRDQAKFDSAIYIYQKSRKLIEEGDWTSWARYYKNMASVMIKLFKNKEALAYADSASFCLEKGAIKDPYLLIDTYTYYGELYQNLFQFELSKEYFDKMCRAAFELQDSYHEITCKIEESKLAFDLGDMPGALKIAFDALELTKKYNYPPQYVLVLNQIGEIYVELGELDLASQYFYKALKISEPLELNFETALIYSHLSWINKEQGNFKYAMDFINSSQQIREKIGDQRGVANCNNIRGLIFFQLKEYENSIREQNKALDIRQRIDYQEGIAASQFNLALVYEEMGQLEKALRLQIVSTEIEERIRNRSGMAISYNALAKLLIKMGKIKEVLPYLTRADEIGRSSKAKTLLMNNAANFVEYYRTIGNFKKALEYQQLFQTYKDSIFNVSSNIKLIELQALYNLEKREQDLELLRQKQKNAEAQIQLQNTQLRQRNLVILLAVIIFILIAIGAYFAYNRYLERKKVNVELRQQKEELLKANDSLFKLNQTLSEKNEEIQAQTEELTEAYELISQNNKRLEEKVQQRTEDLREAFKELDTFFYRSSHDFRRPLTTFMGLAEVAKITIKDSNALELFEKVNETAHTLDKMLVKLQSISDLGAQQLVYKEVFLKEIIDEILHRFKEPIDKHKIKSMVSVGRLEGFLSYPAMIKIVMENLIENAIHFCNVVDPVIKVDARISDNHVLITVEDNGQGIDQIYRDKIFSMYFRASQNSKGNGLGLYIAKKAVDKLNGSIDFVSVLHKGTIFKIVLPLSQEA